MRTFTMFTAILCIAFAPAAFAKDDEQKDAPPPVFQAVLDCKAIADSTERLACYDRTVDTMAAANANRDLVVADRAQVKEAQKGLFGLTLPKIRIFGGRDSDEVKEIESTITDFRRNEDGALIITIADGARWKQIDSYPQSAKIGDKIRIRKAALGSYFANISGRAAIRVSRLAN